MVRKGDGTGLGAEGYSQVRKGDGTVLWNAIPDSVVNRWLIQSDNEDPIEDAIGTADGDVFGSPSYDNGNWIKDWALTLDGVDDYVDTGATMPAGSMGLGITVDFDTQKSEFEYIHAVLDSSNAGGRQIRFQENGDLYVEVINDSDTVFSTQTAVSTGRRRVWMILDTEASELRLAIDGSVASTTSVSGSFSTQLSNHKIGRQPNVDQRHLGATVDEPMIDSEAPTSADLTDDYNRQPWS